MLMLSQNNRTNPVELASDYVLNMNLSKQIVKHLDDDYLLKDLETYIDICQKALNKKKAVGKVFVPDSTFVKAPQGSGKSTLMGVLGDKTSTMTCNETKGKKKATSEDVYTIVVSPTGGNCIHMKKHGFYSVAGRKAVLPNGEGVDSSTFDKRDLKKYKKVVTTPDSLPKVLKVLREEGKLFTVHVDEAHNLVLSVVFREVFGDLKELRNDNQCLHIFCYTATPSAMLNLYSFDNVFTYTKKQQLIEEDVLVYLMKNSNAVNKAALIEKVLTNVKDDEKLIIYLSNVKEQEKITEILSSKNDILNIEEAEDGSTKTSITKQNGDIVQISSKTKTDVNVANILANGKVEQEQKIIIVTSLGACGIEFLNLENATILTFCDNNSFNLINEVQFSRRSRANVKQLILAMSDQRDEKWKIWDYKDYRSYELAKQIEGLQVTEKICNNSNSTSSLRMIMTAVLEAKEKARLERLSNKNGDLKTKLESMYLETLRYREDSNSLELEYDKIENICWNSYATNMLKDPLGLAKMYMKECEHFKFKNQDPVLIVFEDIDEKTPPPPPNKPKLSAKEKREIKENALNCIKEKYKEPAMLAISNNLIISEEKNKELYDLIEGLKISDSTRFKSIERKLKEIKTEKYQKLLWDEYLEGENINKTYKHLKNNEEKQDIVFEIIEDYYYREDGIFSRRPELELMPPNSFIGFVVLTLEYFTDKENKKIKKDKRIRISIDNKKGRGAKNNNFNEFFNYLVEKKYYGNAKKEFDKEAANLSELLQLVFTFSENRLSSIKKVA